MTVQSDRVADFVPVQIREGLALKLKKEAEKVSFSVDSFTGEWLPVKFKDPAGVKRSRFGPYIE
jgi:hypothetical protein